MTFKERLFVCDCGATVSAWRWNTEANPVCVRCHTTMDEAGTVALGKAPGVIADAIPGGVLIRHAICHPDGTPKRYDSMTDIRRAAARAGYTLYGETPKAPNADGHVDVQEGPMIQLLLLIVILGVALYLIETYVPMAPPLKVILRVVVIIAIVLYLLRAFGFAVPAFPA